MNPNPIMEGHQFKFNFKKILKSIQENRIYDIETIKGAERREHAERERQQGRDELHLILNDT